jgi:WD40 repeat protein
MRDQTLVSTNFNYKREKVNLRNYSCTFSVKKAHEDRINCLTYLKNGAFLSGGNDCYIRVWNTLESKPMGNLLEDFPITHSIKMGKSHNGDITVLYVAQHIIRILSLKQQKALFLFKNDQEITAITKLNNDSPIVSFGTGKGMIKDFDVKNKCIIRRAKIHNGARVTSIVH